MIGSGPHVPGRRPGTARPDRRAGRRTRRAGVLDEFLAARLLSQAGQLLASRGELMARDRATVGHWIGKQEGRLQWLPPEAGAFCCVRLGLAYPPSGDLEMGLGIIADALG